MKLVEKLKFWKQGVEQSQPEKLLQAVEEWNDCFDVLVDCAWTSFRSTGNTDGLAAIGRALESLSAKANKFGDELQRTPVAEG